MILVPSGDPARPSGLLPRLVHTFGGGLIRLWARCCFNARIRIASALVAGRGPVLFAANHRSFADPPLVGCLCRDPVAYFARADLWRNPLFASMLNTFYGIPVERENPLASSTKNAIDRLSRGISVLMFPEGTRTRDGRLQRMREGPAFIARRAGVAIVPVYLHRSEAAWPRASILPRPWGGRVEIRFGAPMRAPSDLAPREQDAWLTRRMNAWMCLQERRLLRPRA